jgi:predicted urease superfamily metal-dependent hydrolase
MLSIDLEDAMKAHVGDRFVVEGTHLEDPRRVGVVIEVEHPDGSPPYRVRWLADDHESLFFPGPDARLEPKSREAG